MKINNNLYKNKQNFTSLNPLAAPLGMFYDKNATLPTLFIETGVTLGRSVQANKRGGKKEAVDRFVEQGASAAVWIWGVQILKKIGETIGKKVLKLDNLDFSVGRDILRDPIKNNKINSKTAGFKVGNLLVSTAIATYFIGFILPKISSSISKKYGEKKEPKTSNPSNSSKITALTLEEFKNKTNKNNKNLAFTSLLDKSISLANTLENNSTARLLATDTGVIAGRCKNAPNKYKKIENLFRDTSSIYFYLFSTSHCVNILNHLTKNTDINPKILSKITEQLKDFNGSKEEFLDFALGSIDKNSKQELDNLFNSKEIVGLEEFLEKFPSFKEKAYKMSELQPIFNDKRVLTKMQAKDVLSTGKISDPEFLKETFASATKGASNDKLKFVSKRELEGMRQSMDKFVKQIYNSSSDKIDGGFIKKIANKNIIKNFGFYSLGTALSTFALAILIPKIQYAITRKLTGKQGAPE